MKIRKLLMLSILVASQEYWLHATTPVTGYSFATGPGWRRGDIGGLGINVKLGDTTYVLAANDGSYKQGPELKNIKKVLESRSWDDWTTRAIYMQPVTIYDPGAKKNKVYMIVCEGAEIGEVGKHKKGKESMLAYDEMPGAATSGGSIKSGNFVKGMSQYSDTAIWHLSYTGIRYAPVNNVLGLQAIVNLEATNWYGYKAVVQPTFDMSKYVTQIANELLQSSKSVKDLKKAASTVMQDASVILIPDVTYQSLIAQKNTAKFIIAADNNGLKDINLGINLYKNDVKTTYALAGKNSVNASLNTYLQSLTVAELSQGIFMHPYLADMYGRNIKKSLPTSGNFALWIAVYDSQGNFKGSYRLSQTSEDVKLPIDKNQVEITRSKVDSANVQASQTTYGKTLFITTNPTKKLTSRGRTTTGTGSLGTPSSSGGVTTSGKSGFSF